MDQTTLKSILDYSPDTGYFRWKSSKPPRAIKGEIAGYNNGSGYIKISIKGVRYYAHRLVFLWMTGKIPDTVDHINGIKHDNRWENLREVSQRVNASNSTRGNGVRKRYGKWYARYSDIHLGTFVTKEEAVEAYTAARNEAAQLDPEQVRKSLICPDMQPTKWNYTRREYQGKSLNQWAKELGIPQPTLAHKVTVQGISLEEIVRGMTTN